MPISVYNLPFASAATGTSKFQIDPGSRCAIIVSGMTSWAGGTTNEVMTLRAGLSATDTHATVTSCTITTFNVKGCYVMPYPPPTQFVSVGFTTAPTSSGSIDLAVFTER